MALAAIAVAVEAGSTQTGTALPAAAQVGFGQPTSRAVPAPDTDRRGADDQRPQVVQPKRTVAVLGTEDSTAIDAGSSTVPTTTPAGVSATTSPGGSEGDSTTTSTDAGTTTTTTTQPTRGPTTTTTSTTTTTTTDPSDDGPGDGGGGGGDHSRAPQTRPLAG